ncbi:hypothetical protein BE15_07515, partial [Sorangium cellulosum]
EVEPERLEMMQALLAEAKAQVGTLRVRVKNAPDAEVYVDGERVPEEGVKHEVYLEPGGHEVVIRRAGYEDEVVQVFAAPGIAETVTRELKPKAMKGPEAAVPEASEAEPVKLSEAPIVVPVRSAEVHASGPRKAVLIGGAATAGAAAVAGVVFAVLANAKGSDAEERRDSVVRAHGAAACSRADAPSAACADLRDAFEVHQSWTNAAFWTFVGAGAAGAGTLIYGLSTKPSTPHGRVRVMPLVGADSVGILVTGVL